MYPAFDACSEEADPMSERDITRRLHQLAEERVPAGEDLWPAIRARVSAERNRSKVSSCTPAPNAGASFFMQSALSAAAISLVLLVGLWFSARLWLPSDRISATAAPAALATLGVTAALPAEWTPTGTPTLTPTPTSVAATWRADSAVGSADMPASASGAFASRPKVAAPPASPARRESARRG